MTLSAIPVKFQSPSTGLIKDTDVEAYLGGWLGNFFVSGFTPTAAASSVQVVTGVCMIEGHWVSEGTTYVIPFVASGTYVWLQLVRSSGLVTGAQYVATATTPSDAIVICSYVDNGVAVTSVSDLRQPAPILKALQGGAAGDIFYSTVAGELKRLPISASIGAALVVGTSSYPIWGNILQQTPETTVITSTGTYTVPVGATRLRVICQGGGGGGAAGNGNAASAPMFGGGGGGAGQYVDVVLDGPFSASYTVTIGGAGAGTNGGSGQGGTASQGGSTTFGSLVSAIGGGPGINYGPPASAGGMGGNLIFWQSTYQNSGFDGCAAPGTSTVGNSNWAAGGAVGANDEATPRNGGSTPLFDGGAGGIGTPGYSGGGGGGGASLFGVGAAGGAGATVSGGNGSNAPHAAANNTGAGGGGGGSGGGAAGGNSGNGSNGGSGVCVVIAYFD